MQIKLLQFFRKGDNLFKERNLVRLITDDLLKLMMQLIFYCLLYCI